jgi:hypothetical protein
MQLGVEPRQQHSMLHNALHLMQFALNATFSAVTHYQHTADLDLQ